MKPPPPELPPEERAVLERLAELVRRFGIANDAQDHGCGDEARQLRLDAAAGLRALMREHPRVVGLYPGLGPELESGWIESCGWSDLLDAVEARLGTVHEDLVPWDRVVHFRGRATEVPDWLDQLATDAHAAAERRLLECLVREDRVCQAAPLALRALLGALRFGGLVRDPAAVESLARRIGAAARAQAGAGEARAGRMDWSPYREDRLWPPFESAARDEQLRREWRPSPEQVLGWALLVVDLLEEHARLAAPEAPR